MDEKLESGQRTDSLKQEKQWIRNPATGKMMELNTFSGKELFWRETNEENEDS